MVARARRGPLQLSAPSAGRLRPPPQTPRAPSAIGPAAPYLGAKSLRSQGPPGRAGGAPTGLLALYLAIGALLGTLGAWVLMAAPRSNLSLALAAMALLASLAGCTVPDTAPHVLVVLADDLVAVHGDPSLQTVGGFGGHCAAVVLAGARDRVMLRYELADDPPTALLVRKFQSNSTGPIVLTTSADMVGFVRLTSGLAEVRSPIGDPPPLLAHAGVQGDAVRVGDETLAPGGTASLSFSYRAPAEGNQTVQVEETLQLRHLGRLPAKVEPGLLCA